MLSVKSISSIFKSNETVGLIGLVINFNIYNRQKQHVMQLPVFEFLLLLINTMNKRNFLRVYVSLEFTCHSLLLREIKAKTEAEAIEGCCLLACSACFLTYPLDHLPAQGWYHPQRTRPSPLITN